MTQNVLMGMLNSIYSHSLTHSLTHSLLVATNDSQSCQKESNIGSNESKVYQLQSDHWFTTCSYGSGHFSSHWSQRLTVEWSRGNAPMEQSCWCTRCCATVKKAYKMLTALCTLFLLDQ